MGAEAQSPAIGFRLCQPCDFVHLLGPVYSYRISVEEKALLAAIGEPYAAFMRTRKRFIPYVI